MARRTLGLALAAALLSSAGRPSDLDAVTARGSLRVLAVDLKPDEFFQFSGEPGFDREMLEGFAALHRVRLERVAVALGGPRARAAGGQGGRRRGPLHGHRRAAAAHRLHAGDVSDA